MAFHNRSEAGRKLADALSGYKGQDVVVLALPRGGVPVAAEIAEALSAPMDLALVRKVGVPYQPELAMGAVADGPAPIVLRNEDVIRAANVSERDFDEVCQREVAEIARRRKAYLGDRPPQKIEGRTAIVVDDGVATGATMKVALRAVRNAKPKTLVMAVPVGPTSTIAEIRAEVDDLVCLEAHEFFGAIGFFYEDFNQVADDEVVETLARFAGKGGASGGVSP